VRERRTISTAHVRVKATHARARLLVPLLTAGCDRGHPHVGLLLGDSLVTWRGDDLPPYTQPPPPKDTLPVLKAERLALASDTQRILTAAGRRPESRTCRGDTLVWMWNEGLVVKIRERVYHRNLADAPTSAGKVRHVPEHELEFTDQPPK
jgi:hypothetical protein